MILFAKFNQDFNIHNIAYDITRKVEMWEF